MGNTLNQSIVSQSIDNGGKRYISDTHLAKLRDLQKKFQTPKRHFLKRSSQKERTRASYDFERDHGKAEEMKRTAAPQRFRMFHTVGFQGDHEHALTLICLVLKQLDF